MATQIGIWRILQKDTGGELPFEGSDGSTYSVDVRKDGDSDFTDAAACSTTEALDASSNHTGLHYLTYSSTSVNTKGEIAFLLDENGAGTESICLQGMQVGNHDPLDPAIAGDAMELVADAVDSTSVDANAFLAAAFGDDFITSMSIDASVAAEIADAVLEESVDDHDSVADSLAEMVRMIRQAEVGKLVTDESSNSIRVYDSDGSTLLVTLTLSESGDQITRTPS